MTNLSTEEKVLREFDKKFPFSFSTCYNGKKWWDGTKEELKSFLKQSLTAQRKAIVGEVKDKFIHLFNNGMQIGEVNEFLTYLDSLLIKEERNK